MRAGITLQITADDGTPVAVEEVALLIKATEGAEDLGLSLIEGKALLGAIQRCLVRSQVEAWTQGRRRCGGCGRRRRSKGSAPIAFRTLFGDVPLDSPRLHRCVCEGASTPATFSPLTELLPDHVAPERLYLEARWASLAPYGAAAAMMEDVLPIGAGLNATTLRQHALRAARRIEAEVAQEGTTLAVGCPADWEDLPIPGGRVVVGLDGGYVRSWADRTRNFEVIVGRSMPEDGGSRYLGFVHGHDREPERRIVGVLKAQGVQANQDVTFLTDGGEEVRSLAFGISPCGEHVLDWLRCRGPSGHVAMRITVLRQYLRGLAHHEEDAAAELLEDLERLKWLLWHGNGVRAREVLDGLFMDVDAVEADYPHLRRLKTAVGEMIAYIRKNSRSLINYGERYRAGERISSAFVEATVNTVVAKRFAKKQQMQWTPRGAHLLLQTRTRTLDGTLRGTFERWYPGLVNDNGAEPNHARAA